MSELYLECREAKDPSDSKIYTMDWSARLATGVSISSQSWTVPSGLTKVSDGVVGGSTTQTSILVSGGVPGMDYPCTNTIVTSTSETLERTGVVKVRHL